MKKVSVVVLNFKVKELTLKCINSVKKSSWNSLEIIVVDNSSGDNIEEIMTKDKTITFIQSGENLGYTGGNNLGIKKALDGGADYIFILNPDTLVQADTIKKLIEGMEGDSADGACPKIYLGNSKTLWYGGGLFDEKNVLGSHRGVDEKDIGQYDQSSETDYLTGAAMMVRSSVFSKIGLFDNRYFLYYEDSDFSFRMKKEGFKIMYIPKAIVWHENAKSSGLGSPLQDYFISRNRMLFASKFLPIRTRFALLREALRNLDKPMRRLALFDFILGRFGKGSYA